MKSIKQSKVEEKVDISYPCLMECEETVVLMTSPNNGFVVNDTDGYYEIGKHDNGWIDCFKPFTGSILLQND